MKLVGQPEKKINQIKNKKLDGLKFCGRKMIVCKMKGLIAHPIIA